MKRSRILKRAPAYPTVIRSRRYYEDLAQMDYEAAVKAATKRAAATAPAEPGPDATKADESK